MITDRVLKVILRSGNVPQFLRPNAVSVGFTEKIQESEIESSLRIICVGFLSVADPEFPRQGGFVMTFAYCL